MTSYTYRISTLTKPETWTVSEHGLSYAVDNAYACIYWYQDIRSVRLSYFPTRLKTNNFVCTVTLNTGAELKIMSVSYVSFGTFDDLAPQYSAFVKDLVASVAKVNPNCRFISGKKIATFILENAATFFIVVFLFLIFSFFSSAGFSSLVWVRFALIAWYLYYIIKSFVANYPKDFTPDNIPGKILPTIK